MRPVTFGRPPGFDIRDPFQRWAMECMSEIERAAQDDVALLAKDFTIENHTATRTLDVGTATTSDIANVLCTFIEDMQKRGMKRSQ